MAESTPSTRTGSQTGQACIHLYALALKATMSRRVSATLTIRLKTNATRSPAKTTVAAMGSTRAERLVSTRAAADSTSFISLVAVGFCPGSIEMSQTSWADGSLMPESLSAACP
jgi:hypothetical protein